MVHRRVPKKVIVLSKRVTDAARKMSERLTVAGYPHALIGGLAVNHYGYERTTGDVDFLVSSDAQLEIAGAALGGTVQGKTVRADGVTVDLLFPGDDETFLEPAIRGAAGVVPVLPLVALVYMKLAAGRMKDQADVVELLKRGKIDVAKVRVYLKKHRPDLLEDFSSMVDLASVESD